MGDPIRNYCISDPFTQLVNFTVKLGKDKETVQPIGITPSHQLADRNYTLTHTPCLAWAGDWAAIAVDLRTASCSAVRNSV